MSVGIYIEIDRRISYNVIRHIDCLELEVE